MDIIRVLQEYWPSFCKALMITLEMTVFSLIFATIIGTIVGLFNVSKIKPLQFIANIYIDIVRGNPSAGPGIYHVLWTDAVSAVPVAGNRRIYISLRRRRGNAQF